MSVYNLHLSGDFTDSGRLQLRGRSDGCDCCSQELRANTPSEALALAEQWVQDAERQLQRAKELRGRVAATHADAWEGNEE